MSQPGVERAIEQGALFLQAIQKPEGSFDSFSSPVRSPFQPKLTYQTTFTPALILAATSSVPGTDAMRQKLAAWLKDQRSEHWSFNYWAKDAPERTSLPYPDDLDDTFCALIALYSHDPSLINGAALGSIVKLLVATESQVGGPYRTWLASKTAAKIWQDIDLAVNSNVAYFLNLVAEPLPNLTALMEQAIISGKLRSPYYPSAYPLAYYLARAYRGQQTAKLADYLLKRRRQGWWGNPLQTALAVSALTRLDQGGQCAEAIERLVGTQQPDGSWPAEAFCLDPAIKGRTYFCGAPSLTTAFVIEALHGYSQAIATRSPSKKSIDRQTADLHASIVKTARLTMAELDTNLSHNAQAILNDMQRGESGHEIVLLPYLFNQSLAKPVKAPISLFENLGLANLYGWAAYTIYDDFLDDEGQPTLLPVANVTMRRSLQHFRQALPRDRAFQKAVDETFDIIDSANTWEVTRCRFKIDGKTLSIGRLPAFGNRRRLAERSLGHTLTPLAVLAAGGIGPNSSAAEHVKQALAHYIIARQLNDDLHDWQQDLRAGHATYVVSAILHDLNLAPGHYRLERLMAKAERQFWRHSLVDICHTIVSHTKKSQKAAAASGLFKPDNILNTLTVRIDAAVEHTLHEQTKARDFLTAYAGKTGPDNLGQD